MSFTHNTSYVEMEPLAVKPRANVTIVFATTTQNGILFYTGRDQHLAVELFRGRIRVSYDVGNYPVSTMFRQVTMLNTIRYSQCRFRSMRSNITSNLLSNETILSFSYEIVADGEYHHMEILAVKKNFTLKVDGGLARSIINEGKNEYLG